MNFHIFLAWNVTESAFVNSGEVTAFLFRAQIRRAVFDRKLLFERWIRWIRKNVLNTADLCQFSDFDLTTDDEKLCWIDLMIISGSTCWRTTIKTTFYLCQTYKPEVHSRTQSPDPIHRHTVNIPFYLWVHIKFLLFFRQISVKFNSFFRFDH